MMPGIDRGKGFIETIETRRCGLVFEKLSQHQADQLEVVLSECTRGRAIETPVSHQSSHQAIQ